MQRNVNVTVNSSVANCFAELDRLPVATPSQCLQQIRKTMRINHLSSTRYQFLLCTNRTRKSFNYKIRRDLTCFTKTFLIARRRYTNPEIKMTRPSH